MQRRQGIPLQAAVRRPIILRVVVAAVRTLAEAVAVEVAEVRIRAEAATAGADTTRVSQINKGLLR